MITRERFNEIFEGGSTKWEGDNAFQGLQILSKYTDLLITGARRDVIFSIDVDEIIGLGITELDVIKLRSLNWMIESDEYLACFV